MQESTDIILRAATHAAIRAAVHAMTVAPVADATPAVMDSILTTKSWTATQSRILQLTKLVSVRDAPLIGSSLDAFVAQ